MNLYARFAELKKKVGGNREKRDFEFTMGMSVCESNGITPLSPDAERILSEVNFALGLNQANDNKYEEYITQALDVLETCIEAEGALTRTAANLAEDMLMPLEEVSKEYDVIYAAHAHIDMNWMWGFHETVAVTLSTFRTMLNLMKEYPDFTFSQSQASVYRIVEEYDPEMMKEIQARIAEGRWEVTASAWVETDKNMPDTESLIRHISVTRAYLRDNWGIDPESVKVDFSPDTFGHSRFVPEINQFGSVPYYYHCRGLQDDLTLYRFRAPSGSEVLIYKEPYWYNSGVNPDNGTGVFEMERRCNGLKTALIVYGVGDHGGGVTRRDVEKVLEMQKWPVFPQLHFGTLHEYFQAAEKVRDGLPVVDHELNAIFTGCYTTQSRIKLNNRRCEAALLDAEKMAALAHVSLGSVFPSDRLENAWQKTLFTHFHDILTGSCIQDSREYAIGELHQALATAQTELGKAYEKLSRSIDTTAFGPEESDPHSLAEGAGVGYGVSSYTGFGDFTYAGVPNPERGIGKTRVYTVFNPSASARREVAELTLWDYTGDPARMEVVDSEGKNVEFQLLDSRGVEYWGHLYMRVLIWADVPPLGYAVYAVREKEVTAYPTFLLNAEREELPRERIVLENEKIRAGFDTGSGMILSIVDKRTGEEMLSAPAGLYLVHSEDAGMTAWRIGRYLGMEPVTETTHVQLSEGPVRTTVTFDQKVMNSTVHMSISLDAGADTLSYSYKIDWHEIRAAQEWIPLLTYRLPLAKNADNMLTDVPAGYARRASRQIDVPALTGAVAETEGTTLALITDCKYGFRLSDNVLSVTLINTSGDPDPYPERGIHNIRLFVALTDGNPTLLKRKAEVLTHSMTAVPTAVHAGALPAKAELLGFDAEHCVLSAVRIAEDGALLLRLYEMEGREETVRIRTMFEPTGAEVVNLNEESVGIADIVDGGIQVEIGACRLMEIKIYH